MCELSFRGKRLDNGEWVDGGSIFKLINKSGEHFFIPRFNEKVIATHDDNMNIIALEGCILYKVDPETVGEYTGLTDNNGVKIFEGDIVKKKDVLHHNEVQIKGEKYVVQNGSGCWWGIQKLTDYKRAEFLSSFCCSCEVIGNIHDNPELLKEGGEE